MAEEKKTIDSAVLEEVQGGLPAAYRVLKQDVQAMIPYAVKEKLSTAKSDEEARRILSDNGVDLAAINRKIADAGFGQLIGLTRDGKVEYIDLSVPFEW